MKSIEAESPRQLLRQEVEPGMPVVAVSDVEQLRQLGLTAKLQFGIAAGPDSVICRCCVADDIDNPVFSVKEMDMESFLDGDLRLYSCAGVVAAEGDALARARSRVGEQVSAMLSFPGDDFVAECLLGKKVEELVRQEPKAGQHWCSPFKITIQEVDRYKVLETFLSYVEKYRDREDVDFLVGLVRSNLLKLKDVGLPQTHHGIAIEGDRTIHFSGCRLPETAEQKIKVDHINDFMRWRTDVLEGGPVKYNNETSEQRLLSRNRAVWVFCHSNNWPGYDLIRNNCEDFSRFCRVGKKESRQVVGRAVQIISEVLVKIPMGKKWTLILKPVFALLGGASEAYGDPDYIHYTIAALDEKKSLQKTRLYGNLL